MDRILIMDDDIEVCQSFRSSLEDKYHLSIANTFKEGLSLVKENDFDLALFDLKLPDGNGLSLLKWVKKEKPYIDVIMISGLGDIQTAIKAIKLGAYDFIEKPVSEEKLKIILRNLKERKDLIKLIQTTSHNLIITKDEKLNNLIKETDRVAQTSLNVLITGESGVGKDIFAHLIHMKSQRNTSSFIKINCAAIPESLFESELFGHQKGSFTGAVSDKKGKFEMAHMGTLFLDEIAELPLTQQAKLLRVIEDKEVVRVGSEKTIKINVRLICATNCDLEKMVKDGKFREDLYYRLNVINLYIPALRERKNDITLLAKAFLKQIADEEGLPEKVISDDGLNFLKTMKFKGNVRELKNLIQKLFFAVIKNQISKEDIIKFSQKTERRDNHDLDFVFNKTLPLNEAKKELEKQYIITQLQKYNNNVSHTAKALNLLPNNLFRKMKDLGIDSPRS